MKLQFDFTKVVELPNIFSGAQYERLKGSLLAVLVRQKDMVFKRESDPDGNGWQKLSPLTLKARKKGKNRGKSDKILNDTGALRNSISAASADVFSGTPNTIKSTAGNEVVLGTNLPYAAIQNFGGVIHKASTHKIVGRDETWNTTIFIPARPFIGFGDSDKKQVSEKIDAYVRKNGAL